MKKYEYCSIEFSMSVTAQSIFTISKPGTREVYSAGNNNEIFYGVLDDLEKDGWEFMTKGTSGWFTAYYFRREK